MTLGERIRKNEREEKIKVMNKAKKEGLKEGLNKTIRKMLQLKLDESIIKEVTGVNDKQLEIFKRNLLKM